MGRRPSALQEKGTQLSSIDEGLKAVANKPPKPAPNLHTVSVTRNNTLVEVAIPTGRKVLNVLGSDILYYEIRGERVIVNKRPILVVPSGAGKHFAYLPANVSYHDLIGRDVVVYNVSPDGIYRTSEASKSANGDILLFNKTITITLVLEE